MKWFYFFSALGLLCVIPLGVGSAEETKSTPGSVSTFLQLPDAGAPRPLNSHVSEIMQLWEASKKKQAFRSLDKWMGAEKSSPDPMVMAAQLYFNEKEFKKSLSYANKVLKKWPENAEAYFWKAKSFEALGKPVEAANEYQAAMMAKSEFSQAKEGLERVQLKIKESSSGK